MYIHIHINSPPTAVLVAPTHWADATLARRSGCTRSLNPKPAQTPLSSVPAHIQSKHNLYHTSYHPAMHRTQLPSLTTDLLIYTTNTNQSSI